MRWVANGTVSFLGQEVPILAVPRRELCGAAEIQVAEEVGEQEEAQSDGEVEGRELLTRYLEHPFVDHLTAVFVERQQLGLQTPPLRRILFDPCPVERNELGDLLVPGFRTRGCDDER